MLLAAGTRLGPFEIVSPAGAGGMGEVYRARDTRLGRDVAIKVLPAELAGDPELTARLEREARAISSLAHPGICPLYDVGHHDGTDYLVMEYLEGETLAARLARGPMPLDQVFRHGAEIAGALAAAHHAGFVHRDLKPGNIMLTRTGARLLDFGLARPVPAFHSGRAQDATVSAPLTVQGSVLGTLQYMSPEQIEGREVDARSDIFALGAVLYEMATGRRAFDGGSPASVIAAILEREPPPMSSLQPLAPAAFDDLVRGCLAKDPDERWGTAHDVKLQLDALRRRAGEAAPSVVPESRATTRYLPWAVAALAIPIVAIIATSGGLAPATTPAPSDPPVRAAILPPPGHSFAPNAFAISPDGRRLAYVAAGADGVATLWVRSLESGQAIEVAGSEAAEAPFWSPDSRWVAFFAGGRLMKVEPGGIGLQPICDVSLTARGGAWGARGDIVFANAVLGPLFRVSADGGTSAPVTTIPSDMPGEAHRFPQFLPDGRRFLFTASWTNQQRGGVYLADLDGGPPVLIASDVRSQTVLAGDHLIYVSRDTVYARPFDVTSGRLTGSPQPLLRNEIAADWRFGVMPLTASAGGTLVWQSRHNYFSRLVWYDRSGRELEAVGLPGFTAPALSPDGTRVAVAYDPDGTGETEIWIHDLRRGISTPVSTTGTHTALAWSNDGWLAYTAIRSQNGLYRRPGDNSGPEQTIHESPAHLLANAYAPDGSRVLVMDFANGTSTLRAYGVEPGTSDVIEGAVEGAYSPDGQWVAFISQPVPGIQIRRLDGTARLHLSGGMGSQARWRHDMRELFYIAPDKKMMRVPLTLRDGTIEPGAPQPLFQTRIMEARLALFQYDVTRDGEMFLINSLPREDTAAPLTMLTNWRAIIQR